MKKKEWEKNITTWNGREKNYYSQQKSNIKLKKMNEKKKINWTRKKKFYEKLLNSKKKKSNIRNQCLFTGIYSTEYNMFYIYFCFYKREIW